MAITRSVPEGTPGARAVYNSPGGEAGLIRHSPRCKYHGLVTRYVHTYPDGSKAAFGGSYEYRPEGIYADCIKDYGKHPKTGYSDGPCDGPFKPYYLAPFYVGMVLALGEHNYYDDSDFYAVVWDDNKGAPIEVPTGTTRGWTAGGAAVDATPEVVAKYEAWKAERAKERVAKEVAAREAKRVADLAAPARGKHCKVVKGRKVPIGTEGVCVGVTEGRYGARCGISDADGVVHWTATTNVEATLGEDGAPVMMPVPPRVRSVRL